MQHLSDHPRLLKNGLLLWGCESHFASLANAGSLAWDCAAICRSRQVIQIQGPPAATSSAPPRVSPLSVLNIPAHTNAVHSAPDLSSGSCIVTVSS